MGEGRNQILVCFPAFMFLLDVVRQGFPQMVQFTGKNSNLIAAEIGNLVFQVSCGHCEDFIFQKHNLPHLPVQEEKHNGKEQSHSKEEADEQERIYEYRPLIIVYQDVRRPICKF